MDRRLLQLVGGPVGPVVVTALAGAPGRDYDTATAYGVAHWRAAGAAEVVAAPDVRQAEDEALAVLARARVLVLPGGSPSRLRAALLDTPVGALVRELSASGALVVGSSAGAMLLGELTVLPDAGPARGQPPPAGLPVAGGLGLVPGVLVVPHWTGPAGREPWLQAAQRAAVTAAAAAATLSGGTAGAAPRAAGARAPRVRPLEVLGLPEQSGVVVQDGTLTAVGRLPVALVGRGTSLPPGASVPLG